MFRSLLLLFILATATQASWRNLPSAALRVSKDVLGFGELPSPGDVMDKNEKWIQEVARLDKANPRDLDDSSSESNEDSLEEASNVKIVSREFQENFNRLASPDEVLQKVAPKSKHNMLKEETVRENVGEVKVTFTSEEIEEALAQVVPANKYMAPVRKTLRKEDDDESEEEKPETLEKAQPFKHTCLKKSGKKFEHKTAPRVWELEHFAPNELPKAFDWRNVNGVNYCSPTRNQHIPVYCGSCWVFGTTGALNDRFNIARKNRWPMTMVSPQEIIDCNGKGNCQGGEVGNVLEYAKTQGLVEEGCNVYRAVNGECNPFHRCGTCWPNSCDPIQNYTRYYIKDYGQVAGREKIMAELQKGGPLACGIGATPKFEFEYTSGVYAEKSSLEANHIVSLTGWGVDETGTEYWIVRNSWGEAWGEKGWYRVVTSQYLNGTGGEYNMGIEKDCYYADVDASNLD